MFWYKKKNTKDNLERWFPKAQDVWSAEKHTAASIPCLTDGGQRRI